MADEREFSADALLELAVECDAEAAEAVSELFNRFNGGGYDEDNEAGEAGGGGALGAGAGLDLGKYNGVCFI